MNVRPAKLPGPNETCWCGSGKKYKRCHAGEDSSVGRVVEQRDQANRVRPGKVSPRREVPPSIVRPDYAETGMPLARKVSEVKTAEQLVRMRKACRVAAEVLAETGAAVREGITTDALDAIAHEACIKRGAYPSPLNYRDFPKSLCTSVNEVICHGIPDSRALQGGDIVNLDVTAYIDGMHGDTNATFAVGKIDAESEQLVKVTRECMMVGIAAVKPGRPVSDIGRAIEVHAAKFGFGVVRSYCGHGIGEVFHTALQIPHYYEAGASEIMVPGMTFTIEPMITLGTYKDRLWDDGWTVVTADGKRSAQFEHTILVTETGAEILTVS